MLQGGDDDVDALLNQFNLEEKAKSTAQIRENADPPSARVYASFTAHPTSVSVTLSFNEYKLTWLSSCDISGGALFQLTSDRPSA